MPIIRRKLQIANGVSFHLMWQCHNKDSFLEDERVKVKYFKLLKKNSEEYGVQIHAYNFMSTHPHILGTISEVDAFIRFMQTVNSGLGKFINRKLGRLGQAIRDRYKIVPIHDNRHQMTALIYIDMNPVRAGIVNHPRDYKWSSYRLYGEGVPNPLISPAPAYLALGNSDEDRRKRYGELINIFLEKEKCLQSLRNLEKPYPNDQEIALEWS